MYHRSTIINFQYKSRYLFGTEPKNLKTKLSISKRFPPVSKMLWNCIIGSPCHMCNDFQDLVLPFAKNVDRPTSASRLVPMTKRRGNVCRYLAWKCITSLYFFKAMNSFAHYKPARIARPLSHGYKTERESPFPRFTDAFLFQYLKMVGIFDFGFVKGPIVCFVQNYECVYNLCQYVLNWRRNSWLDPPVLACELPAQFARSSSLLFGGICQPPKSPFPSNSKEKSQATPPIVLGNSMLIPSRPSFIENNGHQTSASIML